MWGAPTIAWSESIEIVNTSHVTRGKRFSRHGSREQPRPEQGQDGAHGVELLHKARQPLSKRLVVRVRLYIGHGPDSRGGEGAPEDGEEEEGRPPVEQLRGDAGEDAAHDEAQGVAGAEGREGEVLALGRRRIRGPQDADGRGHDHGGAHAEQAAKDVHPERVPSEARDDAQEAEGAHADEVHHLAAQEVRQLAKGQLEGAGGEAGTPAELAFVRPHAFWDGISNAKRRQSLSLRCRRANPGDFALRHAQVPADRGRDDHAGSRQKRRGHRGHGCLEHEQDLLEGALEDLWPLTEASDYNVGIGRLFGLDAAALELPGTNTPRSRLFGPDDQGNPRFLVSRHYSVSNCYFHGIRRYSLQGIGQKSSVFVSLLESSNQPFTRPALDYPKRIRRSDPSLRSHRPFVGVSGIGFVST